LGGEFFRAERFHEVIRGAETEQIDNLGLAPARGQNDHGHLSKIGIGAQRAQQPPPVEHRHHQIEHDQIRLQRLRAFETGAAVVGGGDTIAARAKLVLNQSKNEGIVVDDENGRLGHGWGLPVSASAAIAGAVTSGKP